MDLVIVGQRKSSGLGSGKEEAFALAQTRNCWAVFRLTQTEKEIVKKGLSIELLYATGDDPSVERRISFAPISPSQRRRGRKRGWAGLQTTPLGENLAGDTIGYLLFVGGSDMIMSRSDNLQNGSQGGPTVVIYEKPDTATFLGKIPDDTSVADLTLPGTHDTCAFYGGRPT